MASQLNNVLLACKTIGYSRDSYYRIKDLYETRGKAALQEISRRKPNHRNRVEPQIEKQVVQIAYDYLAYEKRASNELRKQGVNI